MRKYSRFSIYFSIRIPAHPFKSQIRAFSKKGQKHSLPTPTDTTLIRFPIRHTSLRKVAAELAYQKLFAFLLLGQKRVFCWFASFTPYPFYDFCFSLLIMSPVYVFVFQQRFAFCFWNCFKGHDTARRTFFPSMAFMVSVFKKGVFATMPSTCILCGWRHKRNRMG